MTLTIESARAELRAARVLIRELSAEPPPETGSRIRDYMHALNRYRYARCADTDYAVRLRKTGVNVRELARMVTGGVQ